MVRAGESTRDAFIILKGHLLVTATTTSTTSAVAGTNTATASGSGTKIVGSTSSNAVGVIGDKLLPYDPSGLIVPSLDDDVDGVEEEEEKATTTETATLLCGPGTFLGSQLFTGVSRWNVEIKAVDFATIHAALAAQKQQQQQQQQQQPQLGTNLNGEINTVNGATTGTINHSALQQAPPVSSTQPHNNEKFVSAPSVVLCRIPAEVLLHHKGYTNAKGAAVVVLFFQRVENMRRYTP